MSCGVAAVGADTNDKQNQRAGKSQNAVLDLVVAFAALDGLCVNHSRIAGGFFLRGKVGDHQEHQDCHENQRGQGIHRRLDASAHLAVDQGG